MSKENKNQKEDKQSKLSSVLDNLEKTYGKGSVGIFGEMDFPDVECLSTGSLKYDLLIGEKKFKGFPRGRIVEIYGKEASFKSTICLLTIAEAQRNGEICAFIDAEQSFDKDMAERLGVNVEKLVFSAPETTEQTLDTVEKLVSTGELAMVVVDSVAAMTPLKELEGEFGESHMGVQARLMSQALRKINGLVHRTNTNLTFINQTRDKIGVTYGNPETTTGGNALAFYASLRIRSHASNMTEKDSTGRELGKIIKPKIMKSKISTPSRSTDIAFFYEGGLDVYGEVIDLAVDLGFIKKSGSWYSLPDGTKLGQGLNSVRDFLADNEEFYQDIRNQIIKAYS
jgi:recombination protein RecA